MRKIVFSANLFLYIAALLGWGWHGCALAQPLEPASESALEMSVAERAVALLRAKCFSCHGADKAESGLRVDSLAAMQQGGDHGTVIAVKKPQESLLIESLRSSDADVHMPPKETLSEPEINLLEQWIAAGATWPIAADSRPSDRDSLGNAWEDARNPIRKLFHGERLELWSLRPLVKPSVPAVKHTKWPINPLDCFVLSRWEQDSDCEIAPAANSRTLAMRSALDLTGLPPTFEQIDQFVASADQIQSDPQAYERWVERLMSEPSYGVRWARLWLDVVRYSDSNGFDWDEFRPQAWRFRDYVVDAWNSDLPFDQFALQQLAGDELVEGLPNDEAAQQSLIATGYLRVGPHDNSSPLFNEQERSRAQLLADLTETTGSAFLGLTLSCCRCHDHKTEPLSHADHFRMRAFFAPVEFADDLPLDLPARRQEIEQHNASVDAQLAVVDEQIAAISLRVRERLACAPAKSPTSDTALAKNTESTKEAQNETAKLTDKEVQAAFDADEQKLAKELDARKNTLAKQKLAFTHGLLMRDKVTELPVTYVLFQGDHQSPREPVAAGFPAVLFPGDASITPTTKNSTGRRTALAQWIVSHKNPWTARVIVNRLWQAHFGEGLVATPNDLGFSGARPTYPELLDWLASELIESGWSIKHIQRLIVTSRVYRQATMCSSDETGSTKRTLRTSLRRLDAEALRDRILSVSGLIDYRLGGAPVWPEIPTEILQTNPAFLDDNETKTKGWYPSPADQQAVRSLFLVQKRTIRIPFMETFDLPDNSVSCARREASLVAPQALALLNGIQVEQAATAMAESVQSELLDSASRRVERVFRLALLRVPSPEESSLAQEFIATHTLAELCRALMNTNEFVFID